MIVGMLWFDNSATVLSAKIERAVDYYKKKYSRTPDLCLVHPSMMKDEQGRDLRTLEVEHVTVRPYRPVLPGHIWIDIDESADIEKVKEHNEKRS